MLNRILPVHRLLSIALAAVTALLPAPLLASAQNPIPKASGVAIASAQRITTAPVIDGRLDEQTWLAAPAIEGFVQREPADGAPVSERTVVRVLFDADA